jgi:hypothetical protein
MDLTGHPNDVAFECPPTPWAVRILLGLVSMLFMLAALGCNDGGGARAATGAPPKIQSFSPLSGIAGQTQVTLAGTGFSNFTAVRFGTVAAASVVGTGDTTLSVVVPDGATTGPITVVNPQGSHTSAVPFTVSPRPALAPVVSAFQPTEGPVDTLVNLTGTGFAGATQVTFGGVAATDFSQAGGNTIQARVPAGALTGPLAVVTPSGIHVTDQDFAVLPTPPRHHLPPTVTAFSPGHGGPGTMVVVTGDRFTGATQVAFNGLAASRIAVISDQEVHAYVPMGAITGPITVSTTGGDGDSADDFIVQADPAGSITGFTPGFGARGTLVIITGAGLADATEVAFGGVTAIPEEGSTDAGLLVQVPAGAATGPLTVYTPAGVLTSATPFTVAGDEPVRTRPTLTDVTPTQGRPGTRVTFQGTGLGSTLRVFFFGARADIVSTSDSSVVAIVPDGAMDGPVTVLTEAGTAFWGAFTVQPPPPAPVITDFNPKVGAPGTQVTIEGTNLDDAIQVTFGHTAADGLNRDPAGQLIAVVPPGAPAGTLAVVTTGGITRHATAFQTLASPSPVPSGFSPAVVAAGFELAIQGTDLAGVSTVVFPGFANVQVPVSQFTIRNGDLIVRVPAGAVSGTVVLRHPSGDRVVPGSLAITQVPPSIRSFPLGHAIHGQRVTLSGSGFNTVTEVAIGTQVLSEEDWSHSMGGTRMLVVIPDSMPVGFRGPITVSNPSGVVASAHDITITASRRDALRQTILPDENGMALLDFPDRRRANPYGLDLPQAPVFHPYYPSLGQLPLGFDASRTDQPDPRFTLNFKLNQAFEEVLPAQMQAMIDERAPFNEVQIMVVSQHNVWNSDQSRTDYYSGRDDYEFKPQYWLYPDAPAQSEPGDTSTAMVRVALFGAGAPFRLDADPPALNGRLFNALSDPFTVALGPNSLRQVVPFFPIGADRLVLQNLDYRRTYAFWSLTLTNRVVATLHIMTNDADQALLEGIVKSGNIASLGDFAMALKQSGSGSLPFVLESLVKPQVYDYRRVPLTYPGKVHDQVELEGDLLSGVTGVLWQDTNSSWHQLNAVDVHEYSDGFLVLNVHRDATHLMIRTVLGTSDVVDIDGIGRNL